MATQPNTHLAGIVGRNISIARERADITQHELATRLGTSISRVSGWERGEHLPQPRHQHALADMFFDGRVAALYDEEPVAA